MKNRLPFLDGTRAILAVIILLNHLQLFLDPARGETGVFSLLGFRVPMFFALSGFVLYYSAAGREVVEPSLPFRDLLTRRARRLIPAYYGSLLLGLSILYGPVLLALLGKGAAGSAISSGIPELTREPGVLLRHLLLLQSWDPSIYYRINAPCWMMGYEWQLSLCLPLFLWVVRRISWAGLLAIVLLLQWKTLDTLQHGFFHPVFTLCFVLGLTAARLVRRLAPTTATGTATDYASSTSLIFMPEEIRQMALWVTALTGGIIVIASLSSSPLPLPVPCFAGLFLAALCVYLCLTPQALLSSVLSSAPLRSLGRISYSLFLVHFPFFNLVAMLAGHWHLDGDRISLWMLYLLSLPLLLGFAVVFYRLFETPFLPAAREPTKCAGPT